MCSTSSGIKVYTNWHNIKYIKINLKFGNIFDYKLGNGRVFTDNSSKSYRVFGSLQTQFIFLNRQTVCLYIYICLYIEI